MAFSPHPRVIGSTSKCKDPWRDSTSRVQHRQSADLHWLQKRRENFARSPIKKIFSFLQSARPHHMPHLPYLVGAKNERITETNDRCLITIVSSPLLRHHSYEAHMILQKGIIMQQPRDPESKSTSSYFIHKDRCLSTTFCSAYIGRTYFGSGRSLHTVTSGASRGMPAHGLE